MAKDTPNRKRIFGRVTRAFKHGELSRAELSRQAQEAGIPGRSRLTKQAVRTALAKP